MFKRILVPVDGSDTSNKALVAALELARNTGGCVRSIHAMDEPVYLSGYEHSGDVMRIWREQAGKILEGAMAIARPDRGARPEAGRGRCRSGARLEGRPDRRRYPWPPRRRACAAGQRRGTGHSRGPGPGAGHRRALQARLGDCTGPECEPKEAPFP
jgi:hypothetical protein